MARLVRHDASMPAEVKLGSESKWACMCGLSNNKPYCDGSHKKTSGEKKDRLYVYDSKGNMIEL